ncbi:MAG: ribosome maturation factor RimP [Reyranellaceae bacterium]
MDNGRLTDLERRIAAAVTPTIEGLGYELVRVLMAGGRDGRLQIMAERLDGAAMSVEDCATISRSVSAVLDVEDPIPHAYELEVSSPGIDRPLTRLKDWTRWAGHVARVELAEPVDGRRRVKGVILGLETDVVRLKMDEGGEIAIPLSAVHRAKLVLTDALIEESSKSDDAGAATRAAASAH